MPYAIFEDGSHQFRVREGDIITVDRRDGDPGGEVIFDKVLLIAGDGTPTIGTPTVVGTGSSPSTSASSATRRSSSRSSAAART